MQEYNVVLSETAENDLDDVVEYLSNFSPNIARRYYDEIMVKALSLAIMPQRCPFVHHPGSLCSSFYGRIKGYRPSITSCITSSISPTCSTYSSNLFTRFKNPSISSAVKSQ